jgi:uncharacterized circularly permuted ATP-grasp superfamily protein
VADIFDGYPVPTGLIPRVSAAAEWGRVARGVRQRVRVLEALLADAYGPGRAFADGALPWSLILTSEKFRREVAGITPPSGVRVHVARIDLIRDERGEFRVLEDNVRVLSGVSHVRANRCDQETGHVDEYPSRLLAALRAAAPDGVADPFIVLLTPGAHDAAYVEHTLLARLMGVELVEGRDLFCSRNRVYLRTGHGSRPVDVIGRQVDDEWLDPLHFRPDSLLGCPGLVNAARRGTVTIANGIGSGVADDGRIYAYVPDLIRYYLGEEPVLENVESHRLDATDLPGWAPRRARLRAFAVNDGTGVSVLAGETPALTGQGGG